MSKSTTGPGRSLGWMRKRAGLSIEQVANTACVSPTYLARVEAGDRAPSPAWIGMVSEAIVHLAFPPATRTSASRSCEPITVRGW